MVVRKKIIYVLILLTFVSCKRTQDVCDWKNLTFPFPEKYNDWLSYDLNGTYSVLSSNGLSDKVQFSGSNNSTTDWVDTESDVKNCKDRKGAMRYYYSYGNVITYGFYQRIEYDNDSSIRYTIRCINSSKNNVKYEWEYNHILNDTFSKPFITANSSAWGNYSIKYKDSLSSNPMVYIGEYNLQNKKYSNVHKLTCDFNIVNGNNLAIKEILIDEKYGIIEFTTNSSIKWQIKF
jgi:hypothetical protein